MFAVEKRGGRLSFGLSETTLAAIRAVLARHPDVQEAIVFGSRALGREHPRSDVDIALRGGLSALEAEGIALELEELPVPVRFDVQSLNAIHHRQLREHIARVGQVLYARYSDAWKGVLRIARQARTQGAAPASAKQPLMTFRGAAHAGVCFKTTRGCAAGLLPGAFVSSDLTAHSGDARSSPPRPRSKSPAEAPGVVLKHALSPHISHQL